MLVPILLNSGVLFARNSTVVEEQQTATKGESGN